MNIDAADIGIGTGMVLISTGPAQVAGVILVPGALCTAAVFAIAALCTKIFNDLVEMDYCNIENAQFEDFDRLRLENRLNYEHDIAVAIDCLRLARVCLKACVPFVGAFWALETEFGQEGGFFDESEPCSSLYLNRERVQYHLDRLVGKQPEWPVLNA